MNDQTDLTEIEKTFLKFLRITYWWLPDSMAKEAVAEYIFNSKDFKFRNSQFVSKALQHLIELKFVESGKYYVSIVKAKETGEEKFRIHKQYIYNVGEVRFAVQEKFGDEWKTIRIFYEEKEGDFYDESLNDALNFYSAINEKSDKKICKIYFEANCLARFRNKSES